MRTFATLYAPREVDERAMAEWMEYQLDAGWVPESHLFSISTDDATVIIHLDLEGVNRLTADDVRTAGFVPKAVLYVSGANHHRGNPALAERVAAVVAQHLGGAGGCP